MRFRAALLAYDTLLTDHTAAAVRTDTKRAGNMIVASRLLVCLPGLLALGAAPLGARRGGARVARRLSLIHI